MAHRQESAYLPPTLALLPPSIHFFILSSVCLDQPDAGHYRQAHRKGSAYNANEQLNGLGAHDGNPFTDLPYDCAAGFFAFRP